MESTEIGGRAFRPVKNSTLEHDFWLMERIQRGQLDRLEMLPSEDAEKFARRILADGIASGVLFELLGGLLLPEGVSPEEWTPEMARETAAFLSAATEPRDKARITSAAVSMLVGFFLSGLSSLRISPTSLQQGSPAPEPGPAAVETTETGAASSVH